MTKEKYKTGVITLSDKGSRGQRTDESGPLIRELLEAEGKYQLVEEVLLPDDRQLIEDELVRMCDETGLELILTTGGTGFSPRDITPEATMAVATRNAPGIAEYMRMKSLEITPKGMLSRGVSVIRNRTLIINLPGSPKAVRENLTFIIPALDHGLDILLGRDGECGERQVSFIDSQVLKWLETEAPDRGLCLKRFHADLTVENLDSYKEGDTLIIEGQDFVISQTGKKCFSECVLLKEQGCPCALAKGVAFGKKQEHTV